MNGKHKLRQKVFIQKMPSIKKKIRSLFPCTVFHSDKTSRLHAAQTGSGRHIMPAGTAFLCTVSNAPSQTEPRPTPVSRQGAPHRRDNSSGPTGVPSPQQALQPSPKGPQVKREEKKTRKKRKTEHDNKTLGNSQWKLGTGREPNK